MKLMKNMKRAAALVLLLSAGMANAGVYRFQLGGDYSASWTLDSVASPDIYDDRVGFTLWNVGGNFQGSLGTAADLSFYNAALGGGLEIYDFTGGKVLLVTDGPQLYTGMESGASFRLGTFALTQYEGSGRYTLTVTDLDAAPGPSEVPEPASAALLFGGLGLLYASRKRRRAD